MPLGDPGLTAAFARALPAAVIVPAWGLTGEALSTRLLVAACLALPIAPALGDEPPWLSLAHGVPIAIVAALPLWLGRVHGAISDALVGTKGPFSQLSSVLVALLFFASGAPARVSDALMLGAHIGGAGRILTSVTAGLAIAVHVAGPLIASSVAWTALEAATRRATGDGTLAEVAAGVKRLALLAVAAVTMDRTVDGLGRLFGP